MEVFGKSMVAAHPTNVIFMSSILAGGRDDRAIPCHKCDWRCQNEHVCGNMYLCKLTGITHICDKNCNQRILYDNHSSLCRVSGQVFPLTSVEQQAVRGVRRKQLEVESSTSTSTSCSSTDGCAFKRRRDAQFHPSPFERDLVRRIYKGIGIQQHEQEPITTVFPSAVYESSEELETSNTSSS